MVKNIIYSNLINFIIFYNIKNHTILFYPEPEPEPEPDKFVDYKFVDYKFGNT